MQKSFFTTLKQIDLSDLILKIVFNTDEHQMLKIRHNRTLHGGKIMQSTDFLVDDEFHNNLQFSF